MIPIITAIAYAVMSSVVCWLMTLVTNKKLKDTKSQEIDVEEIKPYHFSPSLYATIVGIAGLSAWCGFCVGDGRLSWVAIIELSVCYMVVLSAAVIDLKTKTIPNYLAVSLIIVRLVVFVFELLYINNAIAYMVSSVVGCLLCIVGLSIANRISKGGIGGGDIKLLSAVAFMCGVYAVFSTMLLALFACGIVACVLLVTRKCTRKDSVPFGPFIWVGFLIMCLMKMY